MHTDRDSQYASVEYRRLLCINGFRQSMSAAGNYYDNAQSESFFSRFKAELLENDKFENIEQAKNDWDQRACRRMSVCDKLCQRGFCDVVEFVENPRCQAP